MYLNILWNTFSPASKQTGLWIANTKLGIPLDNGRDCLAETGTFARLLQRHL